jgi:plasmid stabilization system protein ParE
MFHISFSLRAANDISEAYYFYENLEIGLGTKFLDSYMAASRRIEDHPEALRLKKKNIRYVRLKYFPYLVYFRLNLTKNTVQIFAVLHEKRHPDAWKNG